MIRTQNKKVVKILDDKYSNILEKLKKLFKLIEPKYEKIKKKLPG